MNLDKYTQKSQEALLAAQHLAVEDHDHLPWIIGWVIFLGCFAANYPVKGNV